MKTLKETSVGETVKVVKLNGSGPVKRRELCVRLPPDLCIEIAAISAPACIAEIGSSS